MKLSLTRTSSLSLGASGIGFGLMLHLKYLVVRLRPYRPSRSLGK